MSPTPLRATSRTLRPLLAPLALAVLSACAVGPDYRPPAVQAPDAFLGADHARFTTAEVQREFWRAFGDATLEELIEQALAANHDIRIATARLLEARALRGETQLDLAPTVTASGDRTESRASLRQAPPGSGIDRDQDYYQAGFDAFWELDFFGRTRRAVEARAAQADAALNGVYDAQVSVTAEVARNYFELRGDQQRLEVARRNAENQRETLRITTARSQAGRGTELDTARAQAQLSATLGTIPELEASIMRAILRLGVLTGQGPQSLLASLSQPAPLPELPATHGIGTPEALLRRRPDIRIAERELAAATARIGLAVADLFPRVSFVGRWAADASSSGDLGSSGSESYAFGPSIQWAAFDLGRVRQRILQSEAAAQGALARYERSVLRALEETDASLTDYIKALARREHLERSAAASVAAARLARVRFENGAEDFLAVLDAERSVLEAEDRLALSRTRTATALLAAYKALGGGFRPLPPGTPLARTGN